MPENKVKMINLCSVFLCKDVRETVKYYVEQLGFKSATHYDKVENFATLYRDSIELVIVKQSLET